MKVYKGVWNIFETPSSPTSLLPRSSLFFTLSLPLPPCPYGMFWCVRLPKTCPNLCGRLSMWDWLFFCTYWHVQLVSDTTEQVMANTMSRISARTKASATVYAKGCFLSKLGGALHALWLGCPSFSFVPHYLQRRPPG